MKTRCTAPTKQSKHYRDTVVLRRYTVARRGGNKNGMDGSNQ